MSLKLNASKQGGLADLRASVLAFNDLTRRGEDTFYVKLAKK